MAESNAEPAGRDRDQLWRGGGFVILLLLVGAAMGAAAESGMPVWAAVAVCAVALAVLIGYVTVWLRNARRGLADRAGVEQGQLRPLAKDIQRERIPDDESTRESMRRLVGEQRRQLARQRRLYRWLVPMLIVVYGFNVVVQLLTHGSLTAVLGWLAIGALVTGSLFAGPRRTGRRLNRMAARLEQPGAGRPD
ncbi:hypothetical protein [Streptomyces sp. NBC_00859]|uniref:hypothetical protein n=1 Tax=Streptomyces sp. NBC_00859 TaxID=2903682 RepID=UPI00386FE4D0|nr:hypothetical protein OG584_19840 [Streptomyces sp. NBC_00859]